ncbi:MAG TPA: hypothetical protein VLT33_20645 [Labilithrix sp.]|nr:hypothetical protein [Labilithrix sp.]
MPTTGTRLSVLSMELPRAITPTVAGLTVGAFVGVVGFIAVLLLVGRGSRRGASRRAQLRADQVVFIPPYGTLQRDTPLPPAAFHVPAPTAHVHIAAQAYAQQPAPVQSHFAPGPALPFRPSTNLSARAFAKMGYGVELEDERDSPASDPEVIIECEMAEVEDEDPDQLATRAFASPFPAAPSAPAVAPVAVAAILVVEESGPLPADKSAPHPLGIIPSGSSAMQAAPPAPRPASFADLEMDEGATEIGEPYFDEPPQPRRRTDPPKIRPVAPSGPRFPASAQHLPQPTPPPARAVPSARS